ncbi:MAG TPA: hypothetical protein PLY88_06345 [Candidatus Omnitrophota bacterium]|nr:hypothetical protein [Candidatus Omnitrophota bacterium]
MIFTTKRKADQEEKNWCVVLKSFSSALDRTRLVQKLQRAFEISGEDALDVMQNTPIILLDHLPHDQASKIKDFFSDNGVEIALSNDNFYKRRCYRTVWPALPNIETILKPVAAAPSFVSRPINDMPARVVRENTASSGPSVPESDRISSGQQAWTTSQKEFLEQKDMLIKDSLKLQEEVVRLRAMVDRSLEQVAEKDRMVQILTAEKKEKDLELQRLESQLAATEEKFKIAREEFRDTRSYFEERIVAQESKMQDLQLQAEEMNRLLRDAQSAHTELQKNVQLERQHLEAAKTQIASGEIEWEKRMAPLRHEIDLQKRTIQDYESKIAYLELSKKQVEESENRLRQEMEKQSYAVKNNELKTSQIQTEMERLKQSLETQEKSWASRLQEVEMREKELESARRQIKELHSQLEHRELIQRKVFVAEQIASKELRLKSLVKKQEQLEVEARGRESDLKKLLEEQEAVEKSLIEDRQAQRHLLEKLKSEALTQETVDMLRQPNDKLTDWKPRS